MNYFTELPFPKFEMAYAELQHLLENRILNWGAQNQICLTSTATESANFHLGSGSLKLNWLNADTLNKNGSIEVITKKIKDPLKEADFNTLCDQFYGTIFEDIIKMINRNFKTGRIRLIQLDPGRCLSWHVDDTTRLHYPLKTQEGCLMVIDNVACHLPSNTWWMADTMKRHTALNASNQSRIHLVCSILAD